MCWASMASNQWHLYWVSQGNAEPIPCYKQSQIKWVCWAWSWQSSLQTLPWRCIYMIWCERAGACSQPQWLAYIMGDWSCLFLSYQCLSVFTGSKCMKCWGLFEFHIEASWPLQVLLFCSSNGPPSLEHIQKKEGPNYFLVGSEAPCVIVWLEMEWTMWWIHVLHNNTVFYFFIFTRRTMTQ